METRFKCGESFLIGICVFFMLILPLQATFSIVAYDSSTGEIGGALASCLYFAGIDPLMPNDTHPGVGVIHSQCLLTDANQAYAANLIDLGYNPQQILDSLIQNDSEDNPTIRQYLIIDTSGVGVAYTGSNAYDYGNHIVGQNYVIAGNKLAGQSILDSMEAGFLNTPGTLADKLMAALQGADVPGADTRCANLGISSKVAGIIVARPDDNVDAPYLKLTVATLGVEPIPELQVLYNSWLTTLGVDQILAANIKFTQNYPNPFNPSTTINFDLPQQSEVILAIYDIRGREVITLQNQDQPAGHYEVQWNGVDASGNPVSTGLYFARLLADDYSKTIKMVYLE